MKKNFYVTLALSMFGLSASAQCAINLANVYSFTYNGANYDIIREGLEWEQAALCAVARGGFLCEIDSQEEQDSVFFHMNAAGIVAANTVAPDGGGASYLWLGGNDILDEGRWIWDGDNTGASSQFWQGTSSGTVVGGLFNNWGNEPDDFNGQDGLGLAFTNWPLGVAGQWNDVDVTNALYFVVEYPVSSASLDESLNTHEFLAYPNPTNGIITVDGLKGNGVIELQDLNGKVLSSVNYAETDQEISVDGAAGVYYIKVFSEKGDVRTIKVVKTQK